MARIVPTANNSSRARNRIIGIIIALTVVVFVCIMTAISSSESKKTIRVLRVKDGQSIAANALITEDMVEPYDMYYKEFQQYGTTKFKNGETRSTIVREVDQENVVGKRYAAYYLRGGTVLFWDSTLKDHTRKNSYLYSMTGELLNIQKNTTDNFGDMVVPGDSLNIRASYIDTEYNLPTEEEYKLAQDNGTNIQGVEVQKYEMLFDEVTILDMLNSAGNSIFDIYYEYMGMTKQQQQNALNDKAFLDSVKPSSILVEVTAEEVEHFMKLEGKGAEYTMTLLPRTTTSQLTDSLSEIQTSLSGITSLNSGN